MADSSPEHIPEKRSAKFLKLLQETSNAILAEISIEEFNEIAPIMRMKQEMYEGLLNVTQINSVKGINYAFEQLKIADKIDDLNKLASKCPSGKRAWRPITGEVDISAIEKMCLSIRKSYLQKELNKLDEETESLKQLIIEKRKVLERNGQEIEKIMNVLDSEDS